MPIQAKTIPATLEGRDLVGCAQTGTGKTAAFMLPILHQLTKQARPQVVVVAPTRELAIQIGDNVREYGKYLPFTSTLIYGGVNIEPQIKALRKGVDILVATPGRLLDHMRRRNVSLKSVRHLVLDEADRMLDMGFIRDLQQIMSDMPKQRQTLLFSATMPPEIQRLAKRFMANALEINISPPTAVAEGITHRIYPVPHSLKKQLLVDLLRDEPVDSALIFTRTRRGADNLARYLERKISRSRGFIRIAPRVSVSRPLTAFGPVSSKYWWRLILPPVGSIFRRSPMWLTIIYRNVLMIMYIGQDERHGLKGRDSPSV